MKRFILVMLPILLGGLIVKSVWGQTLYKCKTEDGVQFSSQPCAPDAEKLRPLDGSGGIEVFDGDEVVGQSEPDAHDGPVLKSLSGQVRDNKDLLYGLYLTTKSPQRNCGHGTDINGMPVYIECNE